MTDFNESCNFWTDFRKIHIEFHENPSGANRSVPCGHEGNSRFPHFRECAKSKDFNRGLINIPSIMKKVFARRSGVSSSFPDRGNVSYISLFHPFSDRPRAYPDSSPLGNLPLV